MDLSDAEKNGNSTPIPKLFHSFLEDGPFRHCTICNRDLLQDNTVYLIEKAYKGQEVIFEYAMCMDCREELVEDLSKQSLKLIQHYFEERLDDDTLNRSLEGIDPNQPESWIKKCALTGRSIKEIQEYQICTICEGKHLLPGHGPLLISGQAIEEISKLLSKKTRDRMDGFTEDYLGLPPGVRGLNVPVV